MASPFTPPPAGTPVPPNTSARYYTRTQVFSRVPVNKDNFTSGKQASFILESTGGRHIDFAKSRIVCKMSVKSGSTTADAAIAAASYAAADKKLEKSVRFATDPVTNLFSAGMLSINGTTISSHASNVADVSYLQLRTELYTDEPGAARPHLVDRMGRAIDRGRPEQPALGMARRRVPHTPYTELARRGVQVVAQPVAPMPGR